MKDVRLIINGKKAGVEAVRAAIFKAREYAAIEVRVTWEAGDVARFVQEACKENCKRLIVGGGDGTVKEIVDALMHIPFEQRPELAILPLGTANDFATACGIPTEPFSALRLAQEGDFYLVDSIKANEQFYINVASGGFGAQITTSTPVELKNFFGGGAYTINGLIQALNFIPCKGKVILPEHTIQGEVIVGAVCNSKQAGGGQQLAPNAQINDGLLDIVALLNFPKENILQVIDELREPDISGDYVKRLQAPWVRWESDTPIPTNLDGEPIKANTIIFEVMPKAIKLVLLEQCPVIKS